LSRARRTIRSNRLDARPGDDLAPFRHVLRDACAELSRKALQDDVSILIAAVDAAGRVRGERPRWILGLISDPDLLRDAP
jgi:predicted RNase H-like nuclease